MPSTPLHPALAHLPLGLAFTLPLVAGGLALALARGWLPLRAWAVMVALQLLLVAGGVGAFLAGGQEEHRVEGVVPEALLEGHEERAERFLWAAAAGLVVSSLALFAPARLTNALTGAATAGAVAVAVLGALTGKAGGELVYLHGAAQVYRPGAAPAAPHTAREP